MRVLQVLLAAGDTFRAAAAEQLQLWAGRSGVAVHAATREKARPDNVLYEAVSKVSPVLVAWQCSAGSGLVHISQGLTSGALIKQPFVLTACSLTPA